MSAQELAAAATTAAVAAAFFFFLLRFLSKQHFSSRLPPLRFFLHLSAVYSFARRLARAEERETGMCAYALTNERTRKVERMNVETYEDDVNDNNHNHNNHDAPQFYHATI